MNRHPCQPSEFKGDRLPWGFPEHHQMPARPSMRRSVPHTQLYCSSKKADVHGAGDLKLPVNAHRG